MNRNRRRAIVSVGISQSRVLDIYVERLLRTFSEHAGEGTEIYIWDKEWPPGAMEHRACNYGFKVHAAAEAARIGCESILWMDASCYAIRDLEPLWNRLKRDGHVLIEDANRLGNWCSDRTLAQFGVSRDEAMKIALMCGTCWGLDLTFERSREFLRRLKEYATPDNFNGSHMSRHEGLRGEHPRPGTEGAKYSDDARTWGHRSDETYMSLLVRELGMQTHVGVEFVGGSTVNEQACVRSGYDL
jgi:hypothetical protein